MSVAIYKPEKITKEFLTEAFAKARKAALDADPGDDKDGGSCNMDTPRLKLPMVRWRLIQESAAAAGVTLGTKIKGRFFIFVGTNGQAHQRTVMAEAACQSLVESGLDASMWYHLD